MSEILEKKTVSQCDKCAGCPMRQLMPTNVFVEPVKGAGLRLAVGEFPFEDTHPCSGGASNWLRGTEMSDGRRVGGMYSKVGVKDAEMSFVNILQCKPRDGEFPTDSDARKWISEDDAYKSVTHCLQSYVEPMLKSRPWNRIDLFGDKPLKFLTNKQGIYKWRGSPLAIGLLGEKPICIPTLHPAHIAQNQLMYPVVVNDLSKSLVVPPENYNLYPSLTELQAFTATEFAADIETDGWNTDVIKCVGLCAEATKSIVVPFTGEYINELKRIFKNATDIVTQNGVQFDVPILAEHGVICSPDVKQWDIMLMQHLRFPDLPHDLEFIGSQFCNKPAWKHEKASLELYNARDVDVTWMAYQQLRPLLKQANLLDVYQYISWPLGLICRLMEKTGFKVDPKHIEEVRVKIARQMAEGEKLLPEHLRTVTAKRIKTIKVPEGYIDEKGKKRKSRKVEVEEVVHPWRKAGLIERWLYKDLGLPEQRDAKTNQVTTGKVALEKLSRDLFKKSQACKDEAEKASLEASSKAVNALRTLRKLNSLNTLFCKEEMLDIERMHPHFNVHGTSSGRLSSSDPNLQNVPEAARFIYVPSRPGWKIIDVDYSQIENRLTAHFAGDTERLQRFIDDPGFSEHKYLASLFLKVPYDEVEKSSDPEGPYVKAKKIVHGTNYGEGALKISKLNNLPFKDVKELQVLWKNAIRKTVDWQETCAAQAKKQGYLTNPFDRKRWFWTSSAFTESLSFLPQSTAADIIFRAMIGLLYERINWPLDKVLQVVDIVEPLPEPARILIQVHDSLMFESPEELVPDVIRCVKRVMEQPFKELGGFSIPIGIKVGDSWGESETWKG